MLMGLCDGAEGRQRRERGLQPATNLLRPRQHVLNGVLVNGDERDFLTDSLRGGKKNMFLESSSILQIFPFRRGGATAFTIRYRDK